MKKVLPLMLLLAMSSCAGLQQTVFDAGVGFEASKAGLEEKTVMVNGAPIHYYERPGSGETILLIHGFAAEKTHWIRFVRYMPEGYRYLVPDLPGHGANGCISGQQYDLASQVNAVLSFAEATGVKKFHIAGSSMGGNLAGLLAVRHPDRVLSLVLIDAAGVEGRPSRAMQMISEGGQPLVPKNEEEYQRLVEIGFYKQPDLPWPADAVNYRTVLARRECHLKVWDDYSREMPLLTDSLGKITVPTLIIWGQNDDIIDVSAADIFEAGIKNSKKVIIPECGHVPMLEQPEKTASIMTNFLKETFPK